MLEYDPLLAPLAGHLCVIAIIRFFSWRDAQLTSRKALVAFLILNFPLKVGDSAVFNECIISSYVFGPHLQNGRLKWPAVDLYIVFFGLRG